MSTAGYNLPKLPGKYLTTTLLMHEQKGYSFLLEKIDSDVYEFTICIYDKDDTKKMKRHEYVLHCNKKSLRDLKECFEKVLKLPA